MIKRLWQKLMRKTVCKLKGHDFVFDSFCHDRGAVHILQYCSRCWEFNSVPIVWGV